MPTDSTSHSSPHSSPHPSPLSSIIGWLQGSARLLTVIAVFVTLVGVTGFFASQAQDSSAYGPWMSERGRSDEGGRRPDWYCPNQPWAAGDVDYYDREPDSYCYFRENWACRNQESNDEPAGELCMWSDCVDCAGCNHLDSQSDHHWDDCCSVDSDGNCVGGYCRWSDHKHFTAQLDYCAPCLRWRWRVEGRPSYSTYRDQLGRLMTFDEYMDSVNAVNSLNDVDGINGSLFLHGVPHFAGEPVHEDSPYYLAPSVQPGDLRGYLVDHFAPGISEIQNPSRPHIPPDVWRAWGLQPGQGIEGILPSFGTNNYIPIPRSDTRGSTTGALYAPDNRDVQVYLTPVSPTGEARRITDQAYHCTVDTPGCAAGEYRAIPTPAWVYSWPTATPLPPGVPSNYPQRAGTVDDPADPDYNVRVTTSDLVTGIRVLASGGELCNPHTRSMAVEWNWVDGAYAYLVEVWDIETQTKVLPDVWSFTNRAYVNYRQLSPCPNDVSASNPLVRYEIVVRGYDYTLIEGDPLSSDPKLHQHSTGNRSRYDLRGGGPIGVAGIHTMPSAPVQTACDYRDRPNPCFCAPPPGEICPI